MQKEYNLGVAYALWLVSGCGCLGFHRFYLGKVGTGILWMLSGGMCGIGCIYDAATLPRQVHEANVRARVSRELDYEERGQLPVYAAAPKAEDPEKTVLRVAKNNGGFVTPGEAALEGDLTVDQARKLLESMAAKGLAEMRVRTSGVVVYFFPEFASGPKDEFAV